MAGTSTDHQERIAEIIREYARSDEGRDWLLNPPSPDPNVFRASFNAINNHIHDFDLALWYLSFGQSFGGRTDPMHAKMSTICTTTDEDLILLLQEIPSGCPFTEGAEEKIARILNLDGDRPVKEIRKSIYEIYRSAKFRKDPSWCTMASYENCPYKPECPVTLWHDTIEKFSLRYRKPAQIFFYYDTHCLLHNDSIRSFDELFAAIGKMTDDTRKQTVIIRSLLEQVRGIATKSRMFLQPENIFNNRSLDYSELIFVDTRAVRVAERIEFPNYQGDLVEAIRSFGEQQGLNAREIDVALYDMGSVCAATSCNHGKDGLECIFRDVCSGKEMDEHLLSSSSPCRFTN